MSGITALVINHNVRYSRRYNNGLGSGNESAVNGMSCILPGSLSYIQVATEQALRTGELLVSSLKSYDRVSLHYGDAVEENYDGCV